ncbi:MAG: hypothetical protein ACYTEL_06095 [Planctomycetota bacterium]
MGSGPFKGYLPEIDKAYLRGDAGEKARRGGAGMAQEGMIYYLRVGRRVLSKDKGQGIGRRIADIL